MNTDPEVRLNASVAPAAPPSGGLAVASQSGAVGIVLLDNAIRTGCGISSFVSLGNKADVSGNDLIAYWFDDPSTHAVALYLESFGNPRKFSRIVRALSRRKPVLAINCGRSGAGQRAGASHTAATAVPAATVDALFAQAGVIRAGDLGELLDAARLLTDQPLPTGRRMAIVGNAGGLNVLAADAAEARGLQVPTLSRSLRQHLAEIAPTAASSDNPLDLGTGASPAVFAAVAAAVADSGEADALVLPVIGTRANAPTAILAELSRVIDDHPYLAIAVVVVGGGEDLPKLGRRGAPVFTLPERALTALAHAASYAAWRREPLGRRPHLTGMNPEKARQLIGTALAHRPGWARLTGPPASPLNTTRAGGRVATLFVADDPDDSRMAWYDPACTGRRRSSRRPQRLGPVVREALSNTVRHARATTVRVSVRANAKEVVLTIEDDGVGINPALAW